MTEFLFQPNVITAIISTVLGILVMLAFRRFAFVWATSAVGHFGAALFWLSARSVGRSIWWDVFGGFGFGIDSNWVWNLIGIAACYHALKGIHLLLPPKERRHYTILTVAFYPHRLWRRFDEEDIG